MSFKDDSVVYVAVLLVTENIDHLLLGISVIQSCLFKYLHSFVRGVFWLDRVGGEEAFAHQGNCAGLWESWCLCLPFMGRGRLILSVL